MNISMANNIENLKPRTELSKEEAVAMGRKGGIASGKARAEKKMIKDNIELLLSLPIKNAKTKEQLKQLGIDDNEMNNQMALVIAMYQKALKGDVSAFNTLRDTIGQRPVEKTEIAQAPIINDDIK